MRHALKLSSLAETLSDPIPAELMRAFRFFFSVHIFLNSLKLYWLYADDWRIYPVQLTMLLAALVTLHRRFYSVGILILMMYKGYWIYTSFPMTGNHYFAEFLVLLLLLIFPDLAIVDTKEKYIDGTPSKLILLTVVSIYFYAGVHKLVHGFWLSGEFMARSLFSSEVFGIMHSTKILIRLVEPFFGAKLGDLPMSRSQGFESLPFDLPGWSIGLLLIVSWLVVVTELIAPLLVLLPRTHRIGLWFMLLLQVGIGIYSWETEFMFGATGCILLAFREKAWRNFSVLLALHVIWAIVVVAADFRISEL